MRNRARPFRILPFFVAFIGRSAKLEAKGRVPEQQRFDYLVRKRELSDNELIHLIPSDQSKSYPQREAVLFALCELTGKDLGSATETWRKYFANKAP